MERFCNNVKLFMAGITYLGTGTYRFINKAEPFFQSSKTDCTHTQSKKINKTRV